MSTPSSEDTAKDKALFLHLVMMMSSSAMQYMGKTLNPVTGKTEVDLDGAAFAIDMLAMIAARTTGNREPDEDRLLQSQLASLRLNYVETSASAKPSESVKAEPGQPAPASAPAGDEAADADSPLPPPAASADPNPSRYHKSYG